MKSYTIYNSVSNGFPQTTNFKDFINVNLDFLGGRKLIRGLNL